MPENYTGRLEYDLIDADGNLIMSGDKRLSERKAKELKQKGLEFVEYPLEILFSRYLATPINY